METVTSPRSAQPLLRGSSGSSQVGDREALTRHLGLEGHSRTVPFGRIQRRRRAWTGVGITVAGDRIGPTMSAGRTRLARRRGRTFAEKCMSPHRSDRPRRQDRLQSRTVEDLPQLAVRIREEPRVDAPRAVMRAIDDRRAAACASASTSSTSARLVTAPSRNGSAWIESPQPVRAHRGQERCRRQ